MSDRRSAAAAAPRLTPNPIISSHNRVDSQCQSWLAEPMGSNECKLHMNKKRVEWLEHSDGFICLFFFSLASRSNRKKGKDEGESTEGNLRIITPINPIYLHYESKCLLSKHKRAAREWKDPKRVRRRHCRRSWTKRSTEPYVSVEILLNLPKRVWQTIGRHAS